MIPLGWFQRPALLTREATNNADKCHDLAFSREKRPGYLSSMTLFLNRKCLSIWTQPWPQNVWWSLPKYCQGGTQDLWETKVIFKPLMTIIHTTIFLKNGVLKSIKVNKATWEVDISWKCPGWGRPEGANAWTEERKLCARGCKVRWGGNTSLSSLYWLTQSNH